MKTAAVLAACLAGSASAFTGTPLATSAVSGSSLKMSVWDSYPGGVDFRGKKFEYDPLKLSETYEPLVPWFRECELRHGRTAMIAVMGFIATDFIRIPGEAYSFEAIPKTIDAHDALLQGPMYQLLLWIGLFDLIITAPACKALGDGEREPGDFGLYTFKPLDDAAYKVKQEAELLNGRLAMIAVGGIATQSITNGHGFPYI
jgi:hypothetical protein